MSVIFYQIISDVEYFCTYRKPLVSVSKRPVSIFKLRALSLLFSSFETRISSTKGLRRRRDLLGTASNPDGNSYERSERKYLSSSRPRQSHYAAPAAFTRYFHEFLAANPVLPGSYIIRLWRTRGFRPGASSAWQPMNIPGQCLCAPVLGSGYFE